MRFFALSLDMLLIRYYLMMTCVIVGLFTGQALIAFLALPLFLSAILGVSFLPEARDTAADSAVVKQINHREAQEAA